MKDIEVLLKQITEELTTVVLEKDKMYGSAIEKGTTIFKTLYPDGIKVEQYQDALLLVRTIDKVCKIANRTRENREKEDETPWLDVAGYAIRAIFQDVSDEEEEE
jgi:hypothetical protein